MNQDNERLALQALAWTVADQERAERLLALTGLDPADLRARAGEATVLAGVLRFLEGHEADLVACAESLEVPPERLVTARRELER